MRRALPALQVQLTPGAHSWPMALGRPPRRWVTGPAVPFRSVAGAGDLLRRLAPAAWVAASVAIVVGALSLVEANVVQPNGSLPVIVLRPVGTGSPTPTASGVAPSTTPPPAPPASTAPPLTVVAPSQPVAIDHGNPPPASWTGAVGVPAPSEVAPPPASPAEPTTSAPEPSTPESSSPEPKAKSTS